MQIYYLKNRGVDSKSRNFCDNTSNTVVPCLVRKRVHPPYGANFLHNLDNILEGTRILKKIFCEKFMKIQYLKNGGVDSKTRIFWDNTSNTEVPCFGLVTIRLQLGINYAPNFDNSLGELGSSKKIFRINNMKTHYMCMQGLDTKLRTFLDYNPITVVPYSVFITSTLPYGKQILSNFINIYELRTDSKKIFGEKIMKIYQMEIQGVYKNLRFFFDFTYNTMVPYPLSVKGYMPNINQDLLKFVKFYRALVSLKKRFGRESVKIFCRDISDVYLKSSFCFKIYFNTAVPWPVLMPIHLQYGKHFLIVAIDQDNLDTSVWWFILVIYFIYLFIYFNYLFIFLYCLVVFILFICFIYLFIFQYWLVVFNLLLWTSNILEVGYVKPYLTDYCISLFIHHYLPDKTGFLFLWNSEFYVLPYGAAMAQSKYYPTFICVLPLIKHYRVVHIFYCTCLGTYFFTQNPASSYGNQAYLPLPVGLVDLFQ